MHLESQLNAASLTDIFAQSFAPAIVDFTRWTIDSAIKDGRKRLYFLARDAYLPYIIASRINKEENLNLDIRYLEVSRYSLRKAEFALNDADISGRVAIGGIDVSFSKIMDRAGLGNEEGEAILKDSPVSKGYYDILTKSEIARVREYLAGNSRFVDIVKEKSIESYENAMGYLKQEGLLEDVPFAIVDSGWVGSIQETLRHLLSTVKPVLVTGYYFGLYEIPRGVKKENYKSFFFNPYKDIRKKVFFSNCLFETVFSSFKGMTKEYTVTDGTYLPVYESSESLNAEAIMFFGQRIDTVDIHKNDDVKVKRHLKEMIRVMSHPSKEEAKLLGSLKFCDDVIENTVLNIAAPLSDEDILKIYRVRSGWTEASIVNTGCLVGIRLWYLRIYKYSIYIRKFLKELF